MPDEPYRGYQIEIRGDETSGFQVTVRGKAGVVWTKSGYVYTWAALEDAQGHIDRLLAEQAEAEVHGP